MSTLLIPGMKNQKTMVYRIENYMKDLKIKDKDVEIFDYKSKSVKSDFARLFLNELYGITGLRIFESDAIKRLKDRFKNKNKKNIKTIIAHSHGSLILYDALKYVPDSVTEIHTIGGAAFIPKDESNKIRIVNHYNKRDWVLQAHLKRYKIGAKIKKKMQETNTEHEIVINKKKHIFKFYDGNKDIEAENVQGKNKLTYACSGEKKNSKKEYNKNNAKKHPHKLGCYKTVIENILKKNINSNIRKNMKLYVDKNIHD